MAFASPVPGYSLPILECAAGIAYLSSLPEAQFQDVIAGLRAMELPNSRHALDLIAHGALRQQVRAHGFATRSNVPYTRHPGRTSGIALPLFAGGAPIGTNGRAAVWERVGQMG